MDHEAGQPVQDSKGVEASYTLWARRMVEAATHRPGANLLFDNSVQEPIGLLRECIAQAFGEGVGGYYRSAFSHGNPVVLDALAQRYQLPRDSLLCTTGASNGLALVFQALLSPGDEVLIEQPYFDLLGSLASAQRASVRLVPRRADFSLDLEALEAAITPSTRLIVLTDLHNPSGVRLSDAALQALAALAARTGVGVVFDEVYADFATPNAPPRVAARLSPDFISVNSLTKIYGLYALKCGWIVASGARQQRIRSVYEQFEFGVSKVSHAVAAVVLSRQAEFDAHWQGLLAQARPRLVAAAGAMSAAGLIQGAVPEHGCMYFPRIREGIDDVALSDWLWQRHALAVAPGRYFGSPGHLRIGFGRDAAWIDEGMRCLAEGMQAFMVSDACVEAG